MTMLPPSLLQTSLYIGLSSSDLLSDTEEEEEEEARRPSSLALPPNHCNSAPDVLPCPPAPYWISLGVGTHFEYCFRCY